MWEKTSEKPRTELSDTRFSLFSVTECKKVYLADTTAANFPIDVSRSLACVETKRFHSCESKFVITGFHFGGKKNVCICIKVFS